MAATNIGYRELLKFETRQVSYEWQINDFTTNRPCMQGVVESHPFPREDLPQWFIQLLPRGNAIPKRNFCFYLVLKKAERGEKSVAVDFNLHFLNDNGTDVAVKRFSGRKFEFEGDYCGFTLDSDSTDPIPLSTLGHLIVRVNIFIYKAVKSDAFPFPIVIPKSSAHQDWTKLLKSGDYADFTIESADGQVFPVHKNVLSTRNPLFFGLMFTSATKEAREGRVKLPFKQEIVASLLEYLYSDEVVILTPIATQLYAVAHQYQLDRLTVICTANISQNLTVANISVALHMAKLFGDKKLLSACHKFIDAHKDVAVQMVFDADFPDDLDAKSNGSWLCGLGRFLPNWC